MQNKDDKLIESTETLTDRPSILPELQDICHCKVLEPLGSGGMGAVYLAQQEKPISRKVAIKIVKPTVDSHQVVARFKAEQQALALMNHPYIAQVYESGQTRIGQPYFVMEYVPGDPITTYCDKKQMTITERLELFCKVCDAVQHAHFKGIIHRDLKPSNILVTEMDQVHVPKIIDFGIAKALSGLPLTDETLHTQFGIGPGTPAYMSPEQLDETGHQIDTRTDVYSLGTVLYELLTGQAPFDWGELRRKGIIETLRTLREVPPIKPSVRITTLAKELDSVATKRATSNEAFEKRLKGDLDWITMKALEKLPGRRYASASDLESDIKRHLNNTPVQASPPSKSYRMKKFVLRHRLGVGAAAAVVLCLILGILGTTLGMVKSKKSEQTAIQESLKSKAAVNFLENMFSSPSPYVEGRDIKVLDVLKNSENLIGTNLQDQPIVEASVLHTLGMTYFGLGEYDKSLELLNKALELRQKALGPNQINTLETYESIARVLNSAHLTEESEEITRDALSRAIHVLGSDHVLTLKIKNDLANVLQYEHKYDEAEVLFHEVVDKGSDISVMDNEIAIRATGNIGVLLRNKKKWAEAEKYFRKAITEYEKSKGPDYPLALIYKNRLAQVVASQNRHDESEHLYRGVLEEQKRVLGSMHPDTVDTMISLRGLLRKLHKDDDAKILSNDLLLIKKDMLAPESHFTSSAAIALADDLREQGRSQEAIPFMKYAFEKLTKTQARNVKLVAWTAIHLATYYIMVGNTDEAAKLFDEYLGQIIKYYGSDSASVMEAKANLAGVYFQQGRYVEAKKLIEEYLQYLQKTEGDNAQKRDYYLMALMNLAGINAELGNLEDSERQFRLLINKQTELLGEESPQTLMSYMNLANALMRQKKYVETRSLLETLIPKEVKVFGPDNLYTLNCQGGYGETLYYLKDTAKALEVLQSAYDRLRATAGPDNYITLSTGITLALVWIELGDSKRAEPFLRETLKKLTRIMGTDNFYVTETKKALASALEKLGKKEEAARLNKEIAEKEKPKKAS